jgi:lycopene cyclase domain-containing protein
MSYFGFLAVFLVLPILVLVLVLFNRPGRMQQYSAHLRAIGVLVCVAVMYTTPWDNYLVANQVWWYKPELVTGITLGWVPIEEYTFFILQTVLTGLWVVYLSRQKISGPTYRDSRQINIYAVTGALILWLCASYILFSGWQPGSYLALILVWALPPVALQLAYGADILWRQRQVVVLAILVPTLFLSLADSLAITTGIWTISPQLSLGILLGGVLPIEEFIFFLSTEILVAFGMTLALSSESRARIKGFKPVAYLVNALEIK